MVETKGELKQPSLHHPSSDFSEEIANEPGGEDITKCIQCGMCTASCLVAKYTDRYRPRRLIQKILLGKREEVLNSELPWLCMTCRLCEERCQEGVSLPEIFGAVRKIAAREGKIPNVFKSTASLVLKDGWMLKDTYTDFIEDDRDDLGLDTDLNWDDDFVKKIKKKYFKEDKTR
ncbi:heterodisulfide reductase [Candidatus Thorarchaeota archaeon]|jgi:heterodisulfide reductase subunit C|nr:MAG: heterodisulfide reductase [Candidatus Thorarchaeota archaeon]